MYLYFLQQFKTTILTTIIRFLVTALIVGSSVFWFLCKRQLEEISFLKNKSTVNEIVSHNRIHLADLLILLQRNDTLCLDMRDVDYYKLGHIPNSFPSGYALDNRKRLKNLGRIIVYGSPSSQHEVQHLVDQLKKLYTIDVLIYVGGWGEWKSCGLPIEVSQ